MQGTVPRRVSLRELRKICRKGERDPFWISNIFWRPVSIYVSWLLIRLGITPNPVTLVGAVLAVASSLILVQPSTTVYLVSVVLMQLFFLLDHVDGELARYQAHHEGESWDQSGRYFDVLTHYFQGPTLYYCLGAGLGAVDRNPWWFVLGTVAAIGSSGFPRFVASFLTLAQAGRRTDEGFLRFASGLSHFDQLYWKAGTRPSRVFIIPRNRGEMVFLAKQYIGFPGNLFAFAAAVLLDAVNVLDGRFFFVRLFLAIYATIHFFNTIYATRQYLVYLSRVPE
jgi:phosphatidylglycerophosphate synthase